MISVSKEAAIELKKAMDENNAGILRVNFTGFG